jgi:hypothetical protein
MPTAAVTMCPALQNSRPPDSEQPADVYARNQHLTTDCSAVDIYTQLNSLAIPDGFTAALDDEGDLRCFQVPSVCMDEPLEVTKATMELFCQVEAKNAHATSELFPTLRVPRTGAVRLELPLLRTDPELDCIYLKKSIETRMVAHIPAHSLPEEPLDASADEALEFPQTAYTYRDQLMAAAKNEKLEVDKYAFQLFAQTINAPEEDPSSDQYFSEELHSHKASPNPTVSWKLQLLILQTEEETHQAHTAPHAACIARRFHTRPRHLHGSPIF